MTHPSADRQRIVFLDHLRGLACLLVVFGHVYLMGINDPRTVGVWLPFVDGYIFGPWSPGENPFSRSSTWLVLEANISLGSLGVSIFFLISGYIILATVDRESAGRFLVRRVFRIFPLSLTVAALVGAYTALLCAWAGVASPHSLESILATGFAAPGIVGTFSTVPVIWSLTIEVFYYLAMALLALVVARIEVRHLAIAAVLCGIFSTWTQVTAVRAWLPPRIMGGVVTLGYCAFFTCYLFIGSALYRAHQAGFSRRSLGGVALMAAICALVTWASIAMGDFRSTGTTVQTAIAAFVIFVAAMLVGLRWRGIRWFTFFGDVSYPLYLLHVPTAWAIQYLLSLHGWGMNVATITALAACVALAWSLHVAVEMPMHALGRRLTPGRAAAAP